MIRYNVQLRDGHLPILHFHAPTPTVTGAVASGPHFTSGHIIGCDDVSPPELRATACAHLFEVAANPEYPRVGTSSSTLAAACAGAFDKIGSLLEGHVARGCADYERAFGTQPAVVTLIVRTGPTALTGHDEHCDSVVFCVFMNVGFIISGAAPIESDGWMPQERLLEPMPAVPVADDATVEDVASAMMKARVVNGSSADYV